MAVPESILPWLPAIAGALGYLIGSVPFGLLLSRMAGHGDIRAIGSGNIGATNVLRTGDKKLAALTLLCDGGKGAVGVLIAAQFSAEAAIWAGFGAVVGHNFPVWLHFKGGKGVATTLGVLLAAAWPVGLLACVTWLATAFLFRFSSLAALVALVAAPVYATWLAPGPVVPLGVALAILSVARHRANIKRLLQGTEPRIGKKSAG